MSTTHGSTDFDANPLLAVGPIAECLMDGSLTLFLGAGVSAGFGLPDWLDLIAGVVELDRNAPKYLDLRERWDAGMLPDTDLASMIDEVDDGGPELIARVERALYGGLPERLSSQLQRSPLLLAVVGLVTGSVRGRVDTVTTYNFDDVLEEYLQMLGYLARVRTSETDLVSRGDLTVNHPHGYVPRGPFALAERTCPILSARSYREKRAKIDKGWSAYVEHLLLQKIGLFVGLSGKDESILDLLLRVKETWSEIGRRWGGYWILTPSAYAERADDILNVGVLPLRLEKEEIPEFLLKVCAEAAPTA